MPGDQTDSVDSDSFELWDPSELLPELSREQARYSKGFLHGNLSVWFPGFKDHWLTLAHSFGLDLRVGSIECGFGFPENSDHILLAEVGGEAACVCLSEEGKQLLSQSFVPESEGLARDVVIEYFFRRLLSCLEKSWCGSDDFQAFYLGEGAQAPAVSAYVAVDFLIGESPCQLFFGIGPRLLDRLDAAARRGVVEQQQANLQEPMDDVIHSMSIELAELAVAPAMLIDYMRPGSLIDLEVPLSTVVRIRKDDQPWAVGQLCRFNGYFSVVIRSFQIPEEAISESKTVVRVEVAQSELDHESAMELAHPGAVMLTETAVSNTASLIISGERVATAELGSVDDSLMLRVLPK
jgi:flagellar motor switch/type III secretory pathway protein FliN